MANFVDKAEQSVKWLILNGNTQKHAQDQDAQCTMAALAGLRPWSAQTVAIPSCGIVLAHIVDIIADARLRKVMITHS